MILKEKDRRERSFLDMQPDLHYNQRRSYVGARGHMSDPTPVNGQRVRESW